MENNRFEKSNTCLSPIDEVIKKRFDEKGKLIERRTREETVEYVGGEGVRIRGAHYRSVHKTFTDWNRDWQMEENVTITKPSGERIEIYIQGDNGMNCLIYHCKETFLWGGTFDGHKVDCVKTWIVINGPLETIEMDNNRCEIWGTIEECVVRDGSINIEICLGGTNYGGIILQREENKKVTVIDRKRMGELVSIDLR